MRSSGSTSSTAPSSAASRGIPYTTQVIGRSIVSGANAGVGRDNRNKAPGVHGFSITPAEKADLIAFLECLTDSTFLRNPALSNLWAAGRAPDSKRQGESSTPP